MNAIDHQDMEAGVISKANRRGKLGVAVRCFKPECRHRSAVDLPGTQSHDPEGGLSRYGIRCQSCGTLNVAEVAVPYAPRASLLRRVRDWLRSLGRGPC